MATSQKKHAKSSIPTSYSPPFFKCIPEPSPNLIPSSKSELSSLFAVVAIAGSVVLFCNFFATFFDQQARPFCDSGIDFDTSVSDYCEPCPDHGMCKEGKLECARGYRMRGRLCVEDTDINAAAKRLSELIEVQVCGAHAQYLCSGTGTIWLRKNELWTYLDQHNVMENYGLDEAAYIVAKVRAIDISRKLLETRSNVGGFEEFKCPESLVGHYKQASCRAREWLIKHTFIIVPVSALCVGCVLVLLKVLRKYRLSVRAEELYNQVHKSLSLAENVLACQLLEENALNSRSTNESEPWVVASWLRDYLLLPKERKDPKLWEKVEELVQEDSRLDRYPKMVKGESKVVWEWQVEGALSSSGKKVKTRVNRPDSSGRIQSVSGQQTVEAGRASRWSLMS